MACTDKIKIDAELCLVPCEGIFGDIKVRPTKINQMENETTGTFLERYKNYKKFYEPKIDFGMYECICMLNIK